MVATRRYYQLPLPEGEVDPFEGARITFEGQQGYIRKTHSKHVFECVFSEATVYLFRLEFRCLKEFQDEAITGERLPTV